MAVGKSNLQRYACRHARTDGFLASFNIQLGLSFDENCKISHNDTTFCSGFNGFLYLFVLLLAIYKI